MWHIGRVLGFSGLLAAIAFCGTTEALAQKKKAKANGTDAPRATDADYKSIQNQKELVGKLVAAEPGVLTLRVDYPQWVANPKYKAPKVTNTKGNSVANQQNQMMRTYHDLQLQMQRAATARTPQQALQAQQRIAQDLARWQQQYNQFVAKNYQQLNQINNQNQNPNNQPFMVVTTTKDFDLEIQEKAVYRKLSLPFEYDDTGNVKTYTDKEKAELRGTDKSKPGYTAKFEELQAGQELKLYLTPPSKKAPAAKDKNKDADPDAAPMEVTQVPRPTINMIVITKDNGTTSSVAQPDNGKKKKK
jgi:hypothetical protein